MPLSTLWSCAIVRARNSAPIPATLCGIEMNGRSVKSRCIPGRLSLLDPACSESRKSLFLKPRNHQLTNDGRELGLGIRYSGV